MVQIDEFHARSRRQRRSDIARDGEQIAIVRMDDVEPISAAAASVTHEIVTPAVASFQSN